tara:strand:+ start:534 stop:1007 length:474 start_codon:yes stop_codon:yes gene_type:complete
MINENNVIDKTDMIRKIKHSSILRNEVNEMKKMKEYYKTNLDSNEFKYEAMEKCKFLFEYYTDIFNKIRKDELNERLLFDFLDILEKIENGEINQHDASFQVGSILKKMYIDSAVKRSENIEKKELAESNDIVKSKPHIIDKSKNISWKHFKNIKSK